MLLEHLMSAAETDCKQRGSRAVRYTLHVEEDNVAARGLYEKSGFVTIEKEMYTPRPTEAGPRPERLALLMECRKIL